MILRQPVYNEAIASDMQNGIATAARGGWRNRPDIMTRSTMICNLRTTKLIFAFSLVSLSLAVASRAISWNGFTLAQWWSESRSGLVRSGADTNVKLVALTFDDGPDPRVTPQVLKILKRYHVKATFFFVGRQTNKYPRLAAAVLADGHVIGNHTFTHPYLERKTRRGVADEMQACDATLKNTLHLRTHLFRPPRGNWNPTIFREARRAGDHIILWTVAVEHHDAPTARAMASRALRLIRPGGFVLRHDGGGARSRQTTADALPLLLDGLQKRGYRCVTVPDLLHIRGDDTL